MKKLFVILNIIFFYSITLYSQCAIKEEILSKSSFACPDVPEQYFSQQIYSFCQDSESEYHFFSAFQMKFLILLYLIIILFIFNQRVEI